MPHATSQFRHLPYRVTVAHRISAIIYYTADRLSRDAVDLMVLLREFRRSGVDILAVQNPPSDDPLGRAITFMQGTFAEVERREIAERTKRGKVATAKLGRLPQGTGAGLFGYHYDTTTKTRRTNIDQVRVVRRIFAMAAEGTSVHGIAAILNWGKIPTLTKKLWHPLTVRRLLDNPAFVGRTYYGRLKRTKEEGKPTKVTVNPESEWILIEGATPAIITQELFDRAHQALSGTRRVVEAPKNYLLRGHIFCETCGSPLTGTILSKRYRYYQCTGARRIAGRPAKCDARYVRADVVEEKAWQEVVKILENPEVIIAEARNHHSDDLPYAERELKRIERELKALVREEERLVKALRKGLSQERIVLRELEDIQKSRADLQRDHSEIQASRRMLNDIDNLEEQIKDVCNLVKQNIEGLDYEGKRLALDAITATVIAGPDGHSLYGLLPTKLRHHCTNIGMMTCT